MQSVKMWSKDHDISTIVPKSVLFQLLKCHVSGCLIEGLFENLYKTHPYHSLLPKLRKLFRTFPREQITSLD